MTNTKYSMSRSSENHCMSTLIKASVAAVMTLSLLGTAQAQTCRDEGIQASTPDIRYVDNQDGTVTDKQTGLMWQKCPTGLSGADCKTGRKLQMDWQETLQQVAIVNQSLEVAGYGDWRLPNRKELETLINNQCYSPAINETLFPNTSNVNYWTSSPTAESPDSAWSINFRYGVITGYSRRFNSLMRLVRDN